MADTPLVNIIENSPEHVAFRLFERVAAVEKQAGIEVDFDRKYLLDTYAECLNAVKHATSRVPLPKP